MVTINLVSFNKTYHTSRKENREVAGYSTSLLAVALTKREVVISTELELCVVCVEA